MDILTVLSGEPAMTQEEHPIGHRVSYADQTTATQRARSLLQLRRHRDEMFPLGLFADAAWNILLDLFIASEEKRLVCVSSACIAAAVPTSTALRCIARLEEHDLVRRMPDSKDGRRSFVSITPDTHRRVMLVMLSKGLNTG